MKLIILSVAFLGVFLAPVLTDNNIIQNHQEDVGGSSHQTVNIDHKRQMVNIDNSNGWNSWSSVMDYQTGFMAVRLFSKKSCFVSRMNKQIMPDLTTLPKIIREKQKDRRNGPAPKEASFNVSPKKITDLSMYGKQLQTFCKGIPTYLASEVTKPSFFFAEQSCTRINILFIFRFCYCQRKAYD